jgi:hypothetical protein
VVLDRMLARGSLTGVEVHPRDVFRPLISSGAAAAIFCHNHPSGVMWRCWLCGGVGSGPSGRRLRSST